MINNGIRRSAINAIPMMYRIFDQALILLTLFASNYIWDLTWSIYDVSAVLAFGLFLTFFAEFSALYASWRGQSLYIQIRKTFFCIALSMATFLAYLALTKLQHHFSAKLLLTWFILLCSLELIMRIALRLILTYARRKGINNKKAAIAGAGSLGFKLKKCFVNAPWMGIHFEGFYDDSRERDDILGNLEKLVEDAKNGLYDRVYIALPMRAEKRMLWLVNELSDTTASVYIVPDIFVFELLHARSENINGIPTISIYDSPIEGVNAWIKRMEDIILSSIILCLIAPVMLLIAIAIKATSKGPVFFKQLRYGMGGEPIRVWKFRSMTVMEQGDSVVQATKGDARITPIGGFLRKTSLDELPQFINAFLGDMSIVGPRPHATAHNEYYRKLIDGYMLRHKVKPGITGWAQINGWRGETDTLYKMAKRIKFDLYYIQNWSLWFDIKIVFLTIFKGFIGKNAF